MSSIRSGVGALAFCLLLGCTAQKPDEDSPTEHVVTVRVASVVRSTISAKIFADGIVYPFQQAAIVPRITAPVRKFYVERGNHVRAGQLLAELENRDLNGAAAEGQAALDQAEANYQTVLRGTSQEESEKAKLDVQSTKETLDAAQKMLDSRQALYREGAISQKEVTDAQVALTQSRTQYQAAVKHLETVNSVSREQSVKGAQAQRDAAQARLDSLRTQLSYSRITSPIAGVITDRPGYEGETPQPGAALITVMDTSQIIVRAHVSPEEATDLRTGDTARVISANQEAIAGRVTLVSPALDPAGATIEVWIQAANPNERLKVGANVHAEIVSKTLPEALVIPKAAMIAADGESFVIVVDSANKPQKKEVTHGIEDDDSVQITNGLSQGDRIVTDGAYELANLEDDALAETKLQIEESGQ